MLNRLEQEAWGVMFLSGQQLTPAVYVKSTDSLVWESSCGSGSVVAVHIRHLREKIEIDPSNPRYLKVVWGLGYKIEKEAKQ